MNTIIDINSKYDGRLTGKLASFSTALQEGKEAEFIFSRLEDTRYVKVPKIPASLYDAIYMMFIFIL